MSEISVIKVDNGSYNVFGIDGERFILQGNLTKEQLEKLYDEIVKYIN